MLTDNPVLVKKHKPLPALMCEQKKAEKMIPTEEDFINSNIQSFGNQIGSITNKATSMYTIKARYESDDFRQQVLDYRIACCQLAQQDEIDKAKGIISKGLPKTWFDKKAIAKAFEEDEANEQLYLELASDKKPYFMIYIYDDLKKDYRDYVKNSEKKSLRRFGKKVCELDRGFPEENLFLENFYKYMPVLIEDSVMNKICRRFEEEFDSFKKTQNKDFFDYTILKSKEAREEDDAYTNWQFQKIKNIYDDFCRKLITGSVVSKAENRSEDEVGFLNLELKNDFFKSCLEVSGSERKITDALIDICYKKASSKKFLWSECAPQIIKNLINNGFSVLKFPTKQTEQDGDYFLFRGEKFTIKTKNLKEDIDYEQQ